VDVERACGIERRGAIGGMAEEKVGPADLRRGGSRARLTGRNRPRSRLDVRQLKIGLSSRAYVERIAALRRDASDHCAKVSSG